MHDILGEGDLRILLQLPPKDESAFDASFNFAVSRGIETAIESVPQAILQSLALAEMLGTRRNDWYYV